MANIYKIYMVKPQDGKINYHPAGRIMIDNGNVSYLENYHNMLNTVIPEGEFTPKAKSTFAKMANHPYFRIEDWQEQFEQLSKEPQIQQENQQLEPLNSIFTYHRIDGHPGTLEAHNGSYLLNGHPLEQDELDRIIFNVDNRLASIKHYSMSESEALNKSTAEYGRDSINQDPITHLDNTYSFNAYKKRNKPGFWAIIDLKDFGNVNNEHGMQAGDDTIEAIGKCLNTLNSENDIKAFRHAGDKFSLFATTPETLYGSIRSFLSHLNEIPPVGGTHELKTSIGLGRTPEEAQKSVEMAKLQQTEDHHQIFNSI